MYKCMDVFVYNKGTMGLHPSVGGYCLKMSSVEKPLTKSNRRCLKKVKSHNKGNKKSGKNRRFSVYTIIKH